jgi:hypothetical protein
MGSKSKIFPFILSIIFLSLLTITLTANAETKLETNDQYVISDNNAIVMLSENASIAYATYYPAHFSNIDGLYIPSFWSFANFSTGNGTDNLWVSANNCNITITSFSYLTRNGSEQYTLYTDSCLNYTIEGKGSQTLDYTYLYSSYSPARSQDVYIDGVAKQQGDGWSPTNIGITITGPASRVSIHQASLDYFPPRNAPHLELIDYLSPITVMLALVAIVIVLVLIYRRHRKTISQNKHNV